jgi:hypothetical protein
MDRLFSPCTRYRDIVLSRGRHEEVFRRYPGHLHELNLDVCTQELLSAERAFTYADLHAMLGNENKVVWLTPHAFVVRANKRRDKCSFYLQDDYRLRFDVDGKDIHVFAHSSEAFSDIADVVFRLLAASVVHSVILDSWRFLDETFFNAASLAYLMEQCHSLKALTLKKIALDEDTIRVLGDYSKPDLDIKLDRCRSEGAAATVLAQVLGRNQGPTKLDYCYIDNVALADGLRGNSRLKSFTPCLSTSNQELLAIAGALKENTGLAHLDICYGYSVNGETWDAVCDSLKTHPTLKVLILPSIQTFGEAPLPPAVVKSRIQALVGMLQMNMSIRTIHHYRASYCRHKLFRKSVIPYLETNKFRPRVRAIQLARPIACRVNVLGRALVAARTDVNRLWMLLSGNVDVAFLSTATATTTLAASLPTPATAAATSNAAAVVVTSAVAAAATRTTSTTAASAATNVATPTACCTFTAAVAATATRTASTTAASTATNGATPTACRCTVL